MSGKEYVLGVDTSNYTTSASLVLEGDVVCNIKAPLPVGDGERGLRQSDAVFAHIKNLPGIMSRVREAASDGRIAAVGVSVSPRNGQGSYMPCFLSGKAAAYSLSAAADADVYEFSHQAGHIAAALYSSGQTGLLFGDESFAAFHVSGGTTDIVRVTPTDNIVPLIENIGGSDDLNAGQLIDRAGVMMGCRFPCGAELERLAAGYDGERDRISVSVDGLRCNLSGAENRARDIYAKHNDKARTASYTLGFVTETIDRLTRNLRSEYADIPVIYAGGVMSCMLMRSTLGKRERVYFAAPEYSSDNAAGIAVLTYYSYMKRTEK